MCVCVHVIFYRTHSCAFPCTQQEPSLLSLSAREILAQDINSGGGVELQIVRRNLSSCALKHSMHTDISSNINIPPFSPKEFRLAYSTPPLLSSQVTGLGEKITNPQGHPVSFIAELNFKPSDPSLTIKPLQGKIRHF